jgi:hypothetical protein
MTRYITSELNCIPDQLSRGGQPTIPSQPVEHLRVGDYLVRKSWPSRRALARTRSERGLGQQPCPLAAAAWRARSPRAVQLAELGRCCLNERCGATQETTNCRLASSNVRSKSSTFSASRSLRSCAAQTVGLAATSFVHSSGPFYRAATMNRDPQPPAQQQKSDFIRH